MAPEWTSYKKADHLICPTYIMNLCFNSLRDCINHRQRVLKTQKHRSGCLPTLLYPHFTKKWWRLEWLAAFFKVKVKIVVQTPLWPKRLCMHGLPAHFSDAGHIGCFLYSLLKLRLPQVFVLSVLPASYLMRSGIPAPLGPSSIIITQGASLFTESLCNTSLYLWSLSLLEADWYC